MDLNRICRGAVGAALSIICVSCAQDTTSDQPAVPATAAASAPSGSDASPTASASGPGSVVGTVPVVNGAPSIVVLQLPSKQQAPPPAVAPSMDQVALSFIPSMLIVRSGHPTDFWNSDEVLHNVRVSESSSRQGQFNVAIPQGEKYSFTFTKDGFYDVGCDIHPTMTATLFATSSPYATVTDLSGAYAIPDVPAGTYTLVAYAGAEKLERSVTVAGREIRADVAR